MRGFVNHQAAKLAQWSPGKFWLTVGLTVGGFVCVVVFVGMVFVSLFVLRALPLPGSPAYACSSSDLLALLAVALCKPLHLGSATVTPPAQCKEKSHSIDNLLQVLW